MNMLNEKTAYKKTDAPIAASYKPQIYVCIGENINVNIKSRKKNVRGRENDFLQRGTAGP